MANIDLTKCWTTGEPPQRDPLAEDITKHGALIAFQMHVIRFLEQWLPLAPVANQTKKGAITYADKKTVLSDVINSLRSIGISLVVTLESGKRNSAMMYAMTFDPFVFSVRVGESPKTNRGTNGTGMTATAVAEQIMFCLSGAQLGNGTCKINSFMIGGEEGELQTAEVTISTAYAIIPTALLAD
jgi:hypothetical protein